MVYQTRDLANIYVLVEHCAGCSERPGFVSSMISLNSYALKTKGEQNTSTLPSKANNPGFLCVIFKCIKIQICGLDIHYLSPTRLF